MKLKLFLILVMVGSNSPAMASGKTEISIAPSLLIFNYAEYSDDGSVLDRETGVIPGLALKLGFDFTGDFAGFIGYTVHDGIVTYDGHTQSNQPHKTKTDENLASLKFGLEKRITINDFSFALNIFQDSILWERRIRPANGVKGLSETYQWRRIGLGVNVPMSISRVAGLTLGVEVYRITDPRISVNLIDFGYGQPQLNLSEKNGVKLYAEGKERISHSTYISVNMSYEYYEFGKSESMIIENEQGGSSTIYEPRSESRHFEVQFKITRDF